MHCRMPKETSGVNLCTCVEYAGNELVSSLLSDSEKRLPTFDQREDGRHQYSADPQSGGTFAIHTASASIRVL